MPTRTIQAIFYTRFHPEKGSRVLHQVPEGSITPSNSPSALSAPLIEFESTTNYLIPTQQFCDRLLTFCTNHHRVIGYPVCIRGGEYTRNEFIFNFAVVIEEAVADWGCWGEVVRKLGRLLRGLEEQGGFLSREEAGVWEDENDRDASGLDIGPDKMDGSGVWAGGSKVYALCEMILEDLNNYCECMIPIDDSNTINLKLFPTHPPPAPIHPYQVPLLTISLASLTSPLSSDLTLMRVLPYINGINSVSRISQLADTDLSLTRKAVQHLAYHGCIVLLDIFQFGAVYAPTAEIGGFVVDKSMGEECARYVKMPRLTLGLPTKKRVDTSHSEDDHLPLSPEPLRSESNATATKLERRSSDRSDDEEDEKITHERLVTLYTSLRQGLTLQNWCLENIDLLRVIDVRRFITFGIIKGFLYRVHKYAIAPASLTSSPQYNRLRPNSGHSTIREFRHGHGHHKPGPVLQHKPSVSTVLGNDEDESAANETNVNAEREALPLIRFLDGMHCFDEICTELGMSEAVVEEKIKGIKDVQFVYK